MGIILNSTTDYDMVRKALGGLDIFVVPDKFIDAPDVLGVAEADLTVMLAAQAQTNGTPTVAQIIAGDSPATATDKVFLQGAAVSYCVYLLCPTLPNIVNVSVEDGDQAVDFGGLGDAWNTLGQLHESRVGYWMSKITNWQEVTPITLKVSGPSRSGAEPDTLTGFFGTSSRW